MTTYHLLVTFPEGNRFNLHLDLSMYEGEVDAVRVSVDEPGFEDDWSHYALLNAALAGNGGAGNCTVGLVSPVGQGVAKDDVEDALIPAIVRLEINNPDFESKLRALVPSGA